jgi:hypothetical protein
MLARQLACTSHGFGILRAERRGTEVAGAGFLTVAARDAAAGAAVVRRRHATHGRERLQAVERDAVRHEEFSKALVLINDGVAVRDAGTVELFETEYFVFESLDVHFLAFSVCSTMG